MFPTGRLIGLRAAGSRSVGALVNLVGFLWQSRITPESSYVDGVLGPAIVLTIGGAFMFTPLTAVVTAGVDETDAGAVSGLMNAAKAGRRHWRSRSRRTRTQWASTPSNTSQNRHDS